MRNYKKIEKVIVKCLKDHGIYEDVDLLLIEDYIRSLKTYDDLWEDQEKRGTMINIRKSKDDVPYYQANQSVSLGFQASKNGSAILTKLGITAQERAKLNIKKAEKEDELDALLK